MKRNNEKMGKSVIRIVCLWVGFCLSLGGKAQSEYFFFTAADQEAVRIAAATPWGRKITEQMRKDVDERRRHALKVPLLEGGHLHDYFCPVHNILFRFDWEQPDRHFCRLCGKYWEGEKRYDWAWVNEVHAENLKYLVNCTYLFLATSDTTYAGYIRDMLLDYAGKYPTYFEHNPNRVATTLNSGRMFGQSLDEAVWATDAARAYDVAKEVMTARQIRQIEEGYLRVCAQMLLKRRGGGNWQVWHNSGLAALGVALHDRSLVATALDDSVCGYRHLMRTQVYDDGWWNEGSPVYHYYPLRAMLMTADAVRCLGIDLFSEKLYRMFTSPALGTYADLSFPAHNDGWYGESLTAQARLYELAAQRYCDTLFTNLLACCYRRVERSSPEALLHPVEIPVEACRPSMGSLVFADAGIGVLRSGERTVVLKYGPHGGGHGHPDKLSIAVHDGQREIVPDLGTSAYGVPDYRGWYRKTLAHNTVTVDEVDQRPCAARLVAFEASATGGTICAETEEAYPGVKMQRELALLGNRMTDHFRCRSAKTHIYDYVLLFTEKPMVEGKAKPVTMTGKGGWQKIRRTKRYAVRQVLKVKVTGAELTLRLTDGAHFEVITGEASGIPPRNPALETDSGIWSSKGEPCYPLVVRVRGKTADIRCDWTFDR